MRKWVSHTHSRPWAYYQCKPYCLECQVFFVLPRLSDVHQKLDGK